MWRRRFTLWYWVIICVGGCGAGLCPQGPSNSRDVYHSSHMGLSSTNLSQIPEVQLTDSPLCQTFPSPDPHFPIIKVKAGDVQALTKLVRKARPGTTIMLEDGVYVLDTKQSIRIKVPGLTLRGASRNRDAVRIEGGSSGIVIAANYVTIADLTVAKPRFHSIQVRGERGVSYTRIYNVHLIDAGQQFVKISAGNGEDGRYGDHGLVACSHIEYTTYSKGNGRTPPSYTNGIDILAGKDWVVRDNVIRRIRSEKGPAGPAILVWKNAQNTVIKRNRIVDSWRGIALGLMAAGKRSRGGPDVLYDHQNGLIENNVILVIGDPADAAIENNFARESKIYHNTIFYRDDLHHQARWSIEYRFPPTEGIDIRNNLSNLPIRKRSPFPGEQAVTGGNVTTADAGWFVDVFDEDVHLLPNVAPVDAGEVLVGTHQDFDGTTRPIGKKPDSGADEYEVDAKKPSASEVHR